MLNNLEDRLRGNIRRLMPHSVVNRVRRFRRRDLLRAYADAGIIFIHVPRTAGTSFSNALYGMHINHFTIREMLPLLAADAAGLARFAIVRNPWDRAVSAWALTRAGRSSDGVAHVRSAARYQIPEFRTFEHFVHDWLAHRNLAEGDVVFRAQSDFLLDKDARLAVDHLGRFEDLALTERWLRERHPVMRPLPHLNQAPRHPYRMHYTAASRDAVAQIYARDIDLFGYDF